MKRSLEGHQPPPPKKSKQRYGEADENSRGHRPALEVVAEADDLWFVSLRERRRVQLGHIRRNFKFN